MPPSRPVVGTLYIRGDWIASNLAAGVDPVNGMFGDADDVKMVSPDTKDIDTVSSSIASLTIGGQILGTVGGSDHYGIVAEVVRAVRIGGSPLTLVTGGPNDDFFVGTTGDVKIKEVQ